jgi:hypothetical protein
MLNDVNNAIQLALAPVFLLTAIAGMLNVMTGRLARIIDRGRQLTETGVEPQPAARETVALELRNLERRRNLTSAAITASTFAALMNCVVIVSLFVEVLLSLRLKWLAGTFFTLAALGLVVGLAYFLQEVHLATKTVKIPGSFRAG